MSKLQVKIIKRSLHPIIMEINLQDAIKMHKFPEKKNGWSMEMYLPCIMQNACLATKELIMLLLKHAHWCFGLKRHFFAFNHHTYNTVAEPWLNLNKIFGRNLRVSSNHGREMPGAKLWLSWQPKQHLLPAALASEFHSNGLWLGIGEVWFFKTLN